MHFGVALSAIINYETNISFSISVLQSSMAGDEMSEQAQVAIPEKKLLLVMIPQTKTWA